MKPKNFLSDTSNNQIDLINQPKIKLIDANIKNEYTVEISTTSQLDIIDTYGPFPNYSVLIGNHTDGFPLLLDLTNPSAGSVLIFEDFGNQSLLEKILSSAILINSPTQLKVLIIGTHLEWSRNLSDYPHVLARLAPYEKETYEMIYELSAMADQRRFGREQGHPILLLISNFHYLIEQPLDQETFIHLEWLLKNGPKSQIWTIASIYNQQVNSLNPKFISWFKTKIRSVSGLNSSTNQVPIQSVITPRIPTFAQNNENKW